MIGKNPLMMIRFNRWFLILLQNAVNVGQNLGVNLIVHLSDCEGLLKIVIEDFGFRAECACAWEIFWLSNDFRRGRIWAFCRIPFARLRSSQSRSRWEPRKCYPSAYQITKLLSKKLRHIPKAVVKANRGRIPNQKLAARAFGPVWRYSSGKEKIYSFCSSLVIHMFVSHILSL